MSGITLKLLLPLLDFSFSYNVKLVTTKKAIDNNIVYLCAMIGLLLLLFTTTTLRSLWHIVVVSPKKKSYQLFFFSVMLQKNQITAVMERLLSQSLNYYYFYLRAQILSVVLDNLKTSWAVFNTRFCHEDKVRCSFNISVCYLHKQFPPFLIDFLQSELDCQFIIGTYN